MQFFFGKMFFFLLETFMATILAMVLNYYYFLKGIFCNIGFL